MLSPGIDELDAYYAPDTQSSTIYESTNAENSVTVTSPATLIPTVTVAPFSSERRFRATADGNDRCQRGQRQPDTHRLDTCDLRYLRLVPGTLVGGQAGYDLTGYLGVGTSTLSVVYTPDTASVSIYKTSSGSAR